MLWLTTAPKPGSSRLGPDAGQRGWKLHAVTGELTETLIDVRFRSAVCGLRPHHGWGVDLFITDRCSRCERAVARQSA